MIYIIVYKGDRRAWGASSSSPLPFGRQAAELLVAYHTAAAVHRVASCVLALHRMTTTTASISWNYELCYIYPAEVK